jgi:putative transposase
MATDSIGLDGSLVEGLFQDKEALPSLLAAICRAAMEQEVARHVGAGLHERAESRVGRRNGYKPRALRTRVGEVGLSVPQVRGCEPYHPSLFGKWQRSERALLVACAEMYFQGVSTRNVREVLEVMCDGDVSATTVSQVARELDEKVAAFRSRRLDGHEYPYVKVDARYEKVRVDGRVVSQAVLVTMGYTEQGRREVLDFRLGDSESERTWGEVFVDLKSRGLKGVRLLVSDAHGGIVAAARRHLQGVAWQRCRVHFMRELARKVSYKRAGELMAEARAVFAGDSRRECLLRAEGMALRWEPGNAGVSRLLREGVEDCLAVLDPQIPEDHRRRLASTNELENLMKRLKKRTRVVGVFPDRPSCERLIGSQLLEVHEQWLTEEAVRFNMELAAPAAAR